MAASPGVEGEQAEIEGPAVAHDVDERVVIVLEQRRSDDVEQLMDRRAGGASRRGG